MYIINVNIIKYAMTYVRWDACGKYSMFLKFYGYISLYLLRNISYGAIHRDTSFHKIHLKHESYRVLSNIKHQESH